MHKNIGALKQNTVSIKNNSLSGYSRHFPVLRNVFIKFLYFPGYIHLDISPLQKKKKKKISFYVRKSFYILFSPSLYLFPFSQSLSQSPILHLARTSTPFPVDARLIFPEKPRGLAPSARPLFSHEVYLPAIRLFSPSSSAGSAVCSDIVPDHPNIYEMRVAEPRRRRAPLSGRFPRGVRIKGTYSRVSSTLFNVYVSRRG